MPDNLQGHGFAVPTDTYHLKFVITLDKLLKLPTIREMFRIAFSRCKAKNCQSVSKALSRRLIAHSTHPCLGKRKHKSAVTSKRHRRENSKSTSTKPERQEKLEILRQQRVRVLQECPYLEDSQMIPYDEFNKKIALLNQEVYDQVEKLHTSERQWYYLNRAMIEEGRLSLHELAVRVQTSLDLITHDTDRNITKDVFGWYKKTTIEAFLVKYKALDSVKPESKLVLKNLMSVPASDEESREERVRSLVQDAVGIQFKQYALGRRRDLFSRVHLSGPAQGRGRSMLPTLMESDINFVRSLRPRRDSNILEEVTIGEVVHFVVYVKEGDAKTFCKRITGLPGDSVQDIHNRMLVVPKGCFWAVGDNRSESYDSRHFGAVPAQNLKGKVVYAISGEILRDIHPFPYPEALQGLL